MKILFTKNIDEKIVSDALGSHFSYTFTDVIQIHHHKVIPFDLKNKSLIFTSINGVKAFFENGFRPSEDFTKPNFNKIYAVGKKTKNELRNNGFGTYKVFPDAEEMSGFLIKNSVKEHLLHFCGNISPDILDRTLPLQNIWYKKVILYDTELLYPKIDENHNAAVFFSPSGVRSFAKLNSFDGMKLFSIGKTTCAELKNHTSQPVFYSEKSSLRDLLKIIKEQS